MRIQVVSDLHLEFHNDLPQVAEGADVLVCAGDLAPVGSGAVRYAAEAWTEARHVLYVPGNHEFYGADIDHARGQLAEECARHGITLLDPDAIVIDDVHFIGATLWTDFLLDGLAREPGAHRAALLGISDFEGWITHHGGTERFTLLNAVQLGGHQRPVGAVLAGTPGLLDTLAASRASFWSRGEKLAVGLLPEDEARAVLARPFLDAGLEASADSICELARAADDYPYFLQLWRTAVRRSRTSSSAPTEGNRSASRSTKICGWGSSGKAASNRLKSTSKHARVRHPRSPNSTRSRARFRHRHALAPISTGG